jgi:hypothetical protein
MVTISSYSVRQNHDGKPFVSLEILGDVEFVQSSTTGAFYATAKKCSMSSTFSEEVAKTLIGKQLPGRIERVQVDPYEFTVKETGEVLNLCHSYVYNPSENEDVFQPAQSTSLMGA